MPLCTKVAPSYPCLLPNAAVLFLTVLKCSSPTAGKSTVLLHIAGKPQPVLNRYAIKRSLPHRAH